MSRWLRRIPFLGIAAWMLLSPAYVQVFGQPAGSIRSWRMFHSHGVGTCSAIYDHDGGRVDRYELFGLDRTRAPADFRRIVDADAARAMGHKICEKLGGPADVRVVLRCGTKTGMRTVLNRGQNLCSD